MYEFKFMEKIDGLFDVVLLMHKYCVHCALGKGSGKTKSSAMRSLSYCLAVEAEKV